MGIMNEYIDRKLSPPDLERELLKLISEYNKLRDVYLFVYVGAIDKPIPGVQLVQDDYFIIHDLLKDKKDYKKLDFYIETPGGKGETAEEIVRCLRKNFDEVSFVVSGEAKSAGTIMVLSGDEILMTETGSLGPIDAQIGIGRSVISAYDYVEWVEVKRKEAESTSSLNPFDAIMVAQITPGELGGVFHALKFAEDLVVDWLEKYKFKNWNKTETRGLDVTPELKKQRADEIVKELIDHSKWRLHGRSIKIDDLEGIGLKINRIDKDLKLAEIVYKIQTVCKLLFMSTSTYKIFATKDTKIFRNASPVGGQVLIPQKIPQPQVVNIKTPCPKCGIVHEFYGKLIDNPQIDKDFQAAGKKPFPKDSRFLCTCGFEIDLSGFKNDIEMRTGQKILN